MSLEFRKEISLSSYIFNWKKKEQLFWWFYRKSYVKVIPETSLPKMYFIHS